MVNFMNIGVQLGMVQQSVAPVEEEILTEHKEQDLANNFLQVRETFEIQSHLDAIVNFKQGKKGNDQHMAQSEGLEGFLEDLVPDFRGAFPWPWFIQDSISLKEWKLHHVDSVHAHISKKVHAAVKANSNDKEHDGRGHVVKEEWPDELD